MENKCAVIKDLMPLYVDQVLSNESKELVETHIAGCDECRAELSALSQDVPQELTTGADITTKQAMQALGKSMKRFVKWRVVLAVVLTALLAVGVYHGHYWLFVESTTPIAIEDLEYQLSEMSNGDLVFEHRVLNGAGGNGYTGMTWGREKVGDEMVLLIEATRPLLVQRSQAAMGRSDQDYLGYRIVNDKVYDIRYGLQLKDGEYVDESGDSVDQYEKVMLGGKNDRKIIWQKGVSLPKTDPAVEHALLLWYAEYKENLGG